MSKEKKETIARLNALVSEQGFLIVLSRWGYGVRVSAAIGFGQKSGNMVAFCQRNTDSYNVEMLEANRVLTAGGEIVYDCQRSNSESKS
jgi:hypothetical protein